MFLLVVFPKAHITSGSKIPCFTLEIFGFKTIFTTSVSTSDGFVDIVVYSALPCIQDTIQPKVAFSGVPIMAPIHFLI